MLNFFRCLTEEGLEIELATKDYDEYIYEG
jgi:hypothetical protein